MENLILTGYGWTDYAVAAAVALPTVVGRTFDVDAEPFLPYAAEGGRVSARVREGKFRGDLYQRLNVVQLRIPALREHKDDIRDIADGWWLNHHRRHLTDEQLAALMDYDYPGNVRELLNLLDRATVLAEDDFAALLAEHREMNAGLVEGDAVTDCSLPDELNAAIRRHVRRVFDKYGQNLSRATQALKVARNTVKKYLYRNFSSISNLS